MLGLIVAVGTHCRNCQTIARVLLNVAWIRDITRALTISAIVQYLHLRTRLQNVALDPSVIDRTLWKWSSSGVYLARSAYAMFFQGQSALCGAKEVWRIKAPQENTFFLWLAIQDRCWTTERCRWHGLAGNDACALCSQAAKTIGHILVGCVVSKELWFKVMCCSGWQGLVALQGDTFSEWWLRSRRHVAILR
jgi:hypothetical protein